MDDEAEAREVAAARLRLAKERMGKSAVAANFAHVKDLTSGAIKFREEVKLPVVVKGDVAGSVEAIRSALGTLELSDDDMVCKIDLVFSGVGDVTSSDVAIAAASKAKVLAFNVAANNKAMADARASNVEVGYYSVVYDLLDELAAKVRATLNPAPPGELQGRAEVKKVFEIGKVGRIAGCLVTEGELQLQGTVRIMRGPRTSLFSGAMSTLKSGKDKVNVVAAGAECGVAFKGFFDFAEGDVIECFSSSGADEAEQGSDKEPPAAATAASGSSAAARKKKKK